jgi:predicted NBD/HSP70 family sugar kinase
MGHTLQEQQALVFDLGGTYLRCGIWSNLRGIRAISKMRTDSFVKGHDSFAIWNRLLSHIQTYESKARATIDVHAPIVISFPGPIRNGCEILSAPTVFGRETAIPDVAEEIKKRTGRHVYLLNDISAAAWHFSVNTMVRRFIVVTVSSGIGSKIFDKSLPTGVIDSPAWAGEIGHIVVDDTPEAPVCDCGASGHLGAIASGRGIERLARRRVALNPQIFALSACVTRFAATPSTLNNEDHIVPSALASDDWSLDVIRCATEPLARVLLALIVGVGIEHVTIIGGFALSLGSIYLHILRQALIAGCQYSVLDGKIASLVHLGDVREEACLMGAGVFAGRTLTSLQ